jgi:FtsH-binding integral membrane protein
MSDFDRNYAAVRRFGADRAVAIDASLRAHMLRVYNYMAAGVALTGEPAGNLVAQQPGRTRGVPPRSAMRSNSPTRARWQSVGLEVES